MKIQKIIEFTMIAMLPSKSNATVESVAVDIVGVGVIRFRIGSVFPEESRFDLFNLFA